MKKFDLNLFGAILVLSLVTSLVISSRLLLSKNPPALLETAQLKKIKIGQTELLVEIADTPAKRNQGLAQRSSLPENQGMLFVFTEAGYHPFWMKDTLIPLDFIWIANNKIVAITSHVQPEDYQPPKTLKPEEKVDVVLELNADAARKFNLTPGQKIEF